MALYLIPNGPMPTTANFAGVNTGTAVKTMLQFKPSATIVARIVEWGISFDGAADAAKIKCELIQTNVAATVTASVANDITKLDSSAMLGGDPTTNLIQVATTATGYSATAEGSITAVKIFDLQFVSPAGGYVKQFPLGREPIVDLSLFARIRVTAPAAVNAYCYMVVEI